MSQLSPLSAPERTWIILKIVDVGCPFCGPSGIYFSLGHPHIVTVAQWQKSSFTREPPKTKAELRQMLTEAVRNTQPSAENGSKRPRAKNDRG